MLSDYLSLGLSDGIFPSGFSSPQSVIHAISDIWRVQIWSFLLCNFLQHPITSFFLGPNIPLSTVPPYTFSLYTSIEVKDQDNIIGNAVDLSIWISKF
jgi:hypothetical protein